MSVFEEPLLGLESAAGVAGLTPGSHVWISGTQTTLSAQQDIDWVSQGSCLLATAGGVSMFTSGAVTTTQKSNQEAGIALHAASGAVSVQAQSSTATLSCKQSLTLATHDGAATITAVTRMLMAAGGAYFTLDGENIELGAPGKIEFKASMRTLTSPMGGTMVPLELAQGELQACAARIESQARAGAAVVRVT